MKWSQAADRSVVEAVIAAFREPATHADRLLSALTNRQWTRSYYWLDASGMALYFLAQIESLSLELAVPPEVLTRLRQNRADNRNRVASMFAEFAELNHVFQNAGVTYANLKGFTLSPDSCPQPALRCQLDFDFLVDGKDLELCRKLLMQRGYERVAATPRTWEFKSGCGELASIEDFYKAKQQRCVELHFSSDAAGLPARDERLERRGWRQENGLNFPALQCADQLIGQAVHIFEHLCGPATRLAWLLEYKRHIAHHANDRAFWTEVRERAANNHRGATALGLASLLAFNLFGGEVPAALNEWTVDRLTPEVRLWAALYGRRAVLADFPGTKLYLLLKDQLDDIDGRWHKEKRTLLLPLRPPPRIMRVDSRAGLRKRLRSELYQVRYLLFRLRFHAIQGLHYKIEALRWERSVRRLCEAPLHESKEPHLSNS